MALFVVRAPVVAECLRRLRELRVHRHFEGYLCIRRAAAKQGKTKGLRVDFKAFFDTFLKVSGGPARQPYVQVCIENPPSEQNIWFNPNVAGSYAPSSLRTVAPLMKVVRVTGEKRQARYSLRVKHWALAREHLTFGEKIPVLPLAAFLFRDYAVEVQRPAAHDLITAFRGAFGYLEDTSPGTDEEFGHLYSTQGNEDLLGADGFETWEG